MQRSLCLSFALALCSACHGGSQAACPAPSSTAGGEAEAFHESIEEDIRELIRITRATEMAQRMLAPMLAALSKAYPQVPAAFWQEMAQATTSDEFEALLIDVYKTNVEHEDIRAMLVFQRSPAGQRVIAKMPAIMAASQAAGQKWGARIAEGYLLEAKNRGYKL
jgi:hypothetical protein